MTIMMFLQAVVELAGEILEYSQRSGEDPLKVTEGLRMTLRNGIEVSTQAELDAKFGKAE